METIKTLTLIAQSTFDWDKESANRLIGLVFQDYRKTELINGMLDYQQYARHYMVEPSRQQWLDLIQAALKEICSNEIEESRQSSSESFKVRKAEFIQQFMSNQAAHTSNYGVRHFINTIMGFGYQIADNPTRQCTVITAGMLLIAGITMPEHRRHALYYLNIQVNAVKATQDNEIVILLGATLGGVLSNPLFWEEKNIL